MDGVLTKEGAGIGFRALVLALLALASGHMLSTLLRTIPAISLDLMARDFGTSPQALASLTAIYHGERQDCDLNRMQLRPASLAS